MNGAELKTIRESLNLSRKELAERLDIRSDRSIRHWESQRGDAVPTGVAAAMMLWNEDVDRMARSIAAQVTDEATILVRHEDGQFYPHDELPHSRRLHHACVARIKQILERRGVKVSVRYSDDTNQGR